MASDQQYYHTFTARLFSKIIDYPKCCLALVVAISALALAGFVSPDWPTKTVHWLTGTTVDSEPDLGTSNPLRPRRFRGGSNRTGAFGRADTLLVIDSDQLFTYEGAEALRAIVAELESMPTINSVTWMDNAPPLNIFGLPEPAVPRGQASAQRFKVAKEKAVSNPLIAGQFLSDDARTTVISIGFDWAFVQDDADCSTHIVSAANRVMESHPDVQMKFSTTGPVPIRLMLVADRASNELKYQLIGYGIIIFMAIVLFRGFTVVFLVTLAPVVGVFWTMGFLRYFGLQENPFSEVIVPMLIALVGFADAVHMMVFLRSRLQAGDAPVPACRNTLAAVGLACALTAGTNAIGMGSLITAHNDVVWEFGWACIIGVVAVWISVMLVIPLACYTPWARRLTKGAEKNLVDSNLKFFTSIIKTMLRYPRYVSYFAICFTLALVLFASQIRPDDRTSDQMPQGSEAQRTLAHLDQALGGLDVCQVVIEWKDAKSEPSAEKIAKLVTKVDQYLDEEPLIGHPLSLCRLLKAMPGDDPPEEKTSMLELLPPPLKNAVYNAPEGQASVIFKCKDLGTATYKPVFERIESKLKSLTLENPEFTFELSGGPIWKWRELHRIVMDLMSSLTSASLVIFCALAIVFRSLRIGFIAILPNVLPLAASTSVLVLIGKPLDMASVCALTVSLGIAVDDTIHFITRYQEEQLGPGTRQEKIIRAFEGVGTGMIMTSIVLVSGFGSVLTSNVPDHRTFALMGVVTLISALFCDLMLLPSLLSYFDKDRTPVVGSGADLQQAEKV